MGFKDLIHGKWFRFGFWSVLYIAWVVWLGNWWWLLGLIVLFDLFITKKVKWLFWKKEYKEGEKHNVWLDWLDAIIFAVIFVTFINIFFFQAFKIPSSSMESSLYTGDHLFVSKLTYGPKLPQTPLTIPFTHNVAFGHESYSTLIQNDYRRLAGFRKVRRGDYVVFGFPNGDTVLSRDPSGDYHAWVRSSGRKYVMDNLGPIIVRPADKKDHYVKRCVAVAGDTLTVKDGLVYINGEQQEVYPGVQLTYMVRTSGKVNPKIIDELGMNLEELYYDPRLPGYPRMPLTEAMLAKVESLSNVVEVVPNLDIYPPDAPDSDLAIFPFTGKYRWTRDYFGPLWIPAKGVEIPLDTDNLPLYERIIRDYEHHTLEVKPDGRIFIDSEEAHSYTFAQDYYFMMGDNRHNSLDSRYWGFVPEDHVVGRPAVIWLSTDRDRKFPSNIRWRRFFKFV
ncbi:MAG: S26 family signal peptidase [Bacteroidales bacterium]|nr:S26 family signal peptidase [Bacteroidales bacterium]